MAEDKMIEVYRQLRTAQDKYDYFLLAVAASAVAYALNRTQGHMLSWQLLFVGLAVLCWGLSFYCGCRHLAYDASSLYSNGEMLKMQAGEHPLTGQHPGLIEAATSGIIKALDYNSDKSTFYANLQFRLLLSGALFYIVWHILEMYRLTVVAK